MGTTTQYSDRMRSASPESGWVAHVSVGRRSANHSYVLFGNALECTVRGAHSSGRPNALSTAAFLIWEFEQPEEGT
jgi:hypothetical protein